LYIPSRISIGQPYRAVTATLGPNCAAAGVTDAGWTAFHPTQGEIVSAFFPDRARTEIVDVYDWAPLGRWTWRPSFAYDAALHDVSQYSPYTDVRLASYGRVTVTKTGTRVNIKTAAMRYWQTESRFIGWSGARGLIQYRTPGTTTWHGLKEVYSTTAGQYSYTYNTSAVRDYRVVLRATGTIWESTSPSVRR
jgi:hypothetical protein